MTHDGCHSAHLVSVPVCPGEAEAPRPQLREHRPQLAHQVLVAGAHRLVHHESPNLGSKQWSGNVDESVLITYLLLVSSLEEHLEGHVVSHVFVYACKFLSVIILSSVNHRKRPQLIPSGE